MMKIVIGSLVFLIACSICGSPQSCPTTDHLKALPPLPMCSSIQPKGWKKQANVTVYYVSAFSAAQQMAIQNAYNNWNTREGSQLQLTFQKVNVSPPQNASLPYSYWRIYNNTSPGCVDHPTCTVENWCLSNPPDPIGTEEFSRTDVKPSYTRIGDQLFAHEVGHTYGIDDCTASDCSSAVTIMEQDLADEATSPMSPHCCDSKLMYQLSGQQYGANSCTPILVQGTAALGQFTADSLNATFQQSPESGDSIVVGCLGSGSGPFTAKDNQSVDGITNTYTGNGSNPIASTYVQPPGYWQAVALATLRLANQVVASQSESFTVTCSGNGSSPMDVFLLEYADLGSGANLDGAPGTNTDPNGVSPLSCGSLTTTADNDLVTSLYNFNKLFIPTHDATSHSPQSGEAPADSDGIKPTLGTVPPCPGGQGENCISQNTDLQAGGVSVFPQNTHPGPYTETWTAPLCMPGDNCINPMSCISAAIKVIGP